MPDRIGGDLDDSSTVHDLPENDVCTGDVGPVAEAPVEVSQPRQRCCRLARRWYVKAVAAKFMDELRFTSAQHHLCWSFRPDVPAPSTAGDSVSSG